MASCDTNQLSSSLLKLIYDEALPAATNLCHAFHCLSGTDSGLAATTELPYRMGDVSMLLLEEEQRLGPYRKANQSHVAAYMMKNRIFPTAGWF
jgi:hypothetical protein